MGGSGPQRGYLTTASGVYRFAEMLRGGGVLEGRRLLSPATLELARLTPERVATP